MVAAMTCAHVLLVGFVNSIVGLFFVVLGTSIAPANDDGHSKYHAEFYQHLMQPESGRPCCDDKDCRPAKFKITKAGPAFYIGGKWILPPAKTIIEKLTPDGKGHWCGIGENATAPMTYCAIVPFSGT